MKGQEMAALQEAAILGTGVYRPARKVTNAEVAARCGVSEDWIIQRTGVTTRLQAAEHETVTEMAVTAARQACHAAGVSPADVGCLIVATMSADRIIPAIAPEIAHHLQARDAVAYDIQNGCSGFAYALATARTHIRCGSANYALVIGVDRIRDITDPSNRGTAALFADGAGAVVVGASETEGISAAQRGTLGAQREALVMSATWPQVMADKAVSAPVVIMDGKKVWNWIRSDVIAAIRELLARTGTDVNELSAFIPHQANLRITELLVRELGLPPHVTVARSIVDTGNTGAASVPLALHDIVHQPGREPGGLALLFGFGIGLAYAGQLVKLPAPLTRNQ